MPFSDKILIFKGKNGLIELYMDKLIIKRKELWGPEVEKTIYLNQITGTEVTTGDWPFDGVIHFDLPGGSESFSSIHRMEGPNSVLFASSLNDSAINFKNKIEELQQKLNTINTQVAQVSTSDEIRKFKQLLDEGIITNEEFDKKKKDLLGL
jgi:hypothetical protein